MSLFDGYKKETLTAVTGIMGKAATWVPSDGSDPAGYSAKVLFKNPTKDQKVNGIEFNPYAAQIEFEKGSFPGLEAKVRGGVNEIITIEGTEYLVQKVVAKWDGDLSMAEIVEYTEE